MSQGSGSSTTKNKAIYEATCIYGRKKRTILIALVMAAEK